ncbi:MaoC/PaaZ C-terminal domain-containing protein [Ottowia caeni]|uniref:MaoC/PaaZ C-terminal domain-containing protein n=1 Tax=Ottowia caeni TaxID=2870339 RepID=UPI001E4497DF|nr:MaoC family dehydratase N-terminal domain-containing protein [Ottowia caeni]
MPLNANVLKDWVFEPRHQTYTDRETMLYALSVGFGADPMESRELPFIYERDLKAVPTMAAVLCHLGAWNTDPRTGITRNKVVHGEQRLSFHAPLPPAGNLIAQSRVLGVEDKGADKGALLHVERVISNADTNEPLVTIVQTSFCRADGGFDGSFGPTFTSHVLPERAPDLVVDAPTRADAAILYRLNVDRNPLHIDPEFAARAGFPRPILHGLCTYGIGARMLISHLLDYNPDRLKSFDARFSSAVYPGETLSFEFWRDGDVVSFQAFVRERGKKVLDNGKALVQ